jgi:hypothetical protein
MNINELVEQYPNDMELGSKVKERNGWESTEADIFEEREAKNLMSQLSSLEAKISELTGLVSSLTSRVGELEGIDIQASPVSVSALPA